jgi:hypothetical protein
MLEESVIIGDANEESLIPIQSEEVGKIMEINQTDSPEFQVFKRIFMYFSKNSVINVQSFSIILKSFNLIYKNFI